MLDLLSEVHQGHDAGLVAYQREKLGQIRDYAYHQCPYYRRVFEQVGLERDGLGGFHRLPLLDKATIEAHRREIMSDEIGRLDFHVQSTGGSTGQPFSFPLTYWAGQVDRSHQRFLFDRVIGYQAGDRIAAFSARYLPEAFRSQKRWWIPRPDDVPYPSLAYYAAYLTEENIGAYVEHLLAYRPAIVTSYPSLLEKLATHILDNDLVVPFPIKGVVLAYENAYGWQVERISRAFGPKVFFQYGHAEMCVFAYAASGNQVYTCSPFYGLVEVLDSEGRQVQAGEAGEIVVTGFHNRALPFIRYRTGDRGVFGGEENGITRLKQVLGRTQDYIVTRGPAGFVNTPFHIPYFEEHLDLFRHIKNWQLVQDVPGKVLLRIVKKESFTGEDEEGIRRMLASLLDVQIDTQFVDSIPVSKSGKYRLVVQNVAPEATRSDSPSDQTT